MEPKARHMLIGLFTLLVIIGIMSTVLWLGKSFSDKSWNRYIVEFNESVSGLSRGSAVQYNGLQIGEVVDLRLSPKDMRIVQAYIQIDNDITLRENTEARLSIVGVTGQSVIAMSGGSSDSPVLKSINGKEPVIVATPSALATLFKNGDNLIYNLTETLLSVKQVFSDENAKELSTILKNIASITSVIEKQDKALSASMTHLNTLVQQSTETMKSIDQLAKSSQTLFNQQGKQMLAATQKAMTSLDLVSRDIQVFIDTNKSKIVNSLIGFEEVGPALKKFRQTMTTVDKVLNNLNSNPSGYLLEGNKPKVFKP